MTELEKEDKEYISRLSKVVELIRNEDGSYTFHSGKNGVVTYWQKENKISFHKDGKSINKAWKFIRRNIFKEYV